MSGTISKIKHRLKKEEEVYRAQYQAINQWIITTNSMTDAIDRTLKDSADETGNTEGKSCKYKNTWKH
eukprot:14253223-Ditylum_brightwellii.AAC.1